MKTIISLFFVIAGFTAIAQANTTYGNFKLEDQEIIFQKIFLADGVDAAKLVEYYKTLPYLANVKQDGEDVTFDMNDITVDYKKFMFAQVGTPSIIQTGKYSGAVTIGVKDGKYRVTLRAIQMTGDIGYKKINEKENLTSFAAKNSGTILAQDWCRPNMLGLLDQSFTDKLQFIDSGKKKDDGDW
ncbi:MAG: hypothetical protein OEV74_21655 [Cyclobacteriaceae bacterium]|nr:hypothetical protein [Cyclobacteriaceae bacterium]MDH4298890.1 hypothetical protein [Cyclobacteriaceae bacterium]MDH5250229.1 hypothetical protein [Cyclobacteriaceae bacterium]